MHSGLRRLSISLVFMLFASAALAQQTGAITGRVTASDGSALPGVTVEARSNMLPQARVTTTESNGEYRLPALVPGTYTLTFSLSGMQTATRRAEVLLADVTTADAKLGVAGVSESITVTAETSLVDRSSTEIKSGLSSEQIQALPVGQDYRDLVKLAPGVQISQDNTRGPSAGGSGQDNVYQFDGVNVSLPQYGTLAAEPATHDIAQVSVTKGGAKAVDFNRAGGFTIDSVSKSGSNRFSGQVGFQVLTHAMIADLAPNVGVNSVYNEDRSWAQMNLGGPVLHDRIFFYGSYYHPTRKRENRANLYGPLPEYESKRNEGFAKLTITPMSQLLLNVSYRDSKREDRSSLFGAAAAASTGEGSKIRQKIGILEGSWVFSSRSYVTAKVNDFKYLTTSQPDNIADVNLSRQIGTRLDIANLATLGQLQVPVANNTNAAVNAFRQTYINQFGYICPAGSTTCTPGSRVGGGTVGYATTFDQDDFFRRSYQAGYNLNLGTNLIHDLHVGYQRYTDSENLLRSTNGWGSIAVLGGSATCPAATACTGQPIFFQAAFQQQAIGIPPIHSELKSENFEINDTMRWGNWSFNAGVLASHDIYYGQGLRKADNVAGFLSAVGNKYQMYDIPFKKMIQPRLGATWAYNGSDTVYASFAVYNPVTSSLPRAASWDRNLRATIAGYFDANGLLIGSQNVASSSGKLFMPDMKPRTTRELMAGTSKQFTSNWSGRAYTRYRHTDHFWEDTNNNARLCFTNIVNGACSASSVPSNAPANIPHVPYMPDLQARRIAIGSGTASGDTYVIANLDGAFTKFYEATLESDWRANKTFVRGTYTWSHYYGNFDQDGSTSCAGNPPAANTPCDDQNTFIGSSNIADSAGRQIWDNKYGDLHGDRRHLLKLYGSYSFPWQGSVGALGYYQSGTPWEAWDYHYYQPLTGASTSDTIRYAERAGTRRTPGHQQLDLNYIQNIPLTRGFNLQVQADMFNAFDKQTPRKFQPSKNSAVFGQPILFYQPRRYQLAARIQF